MFQCDCISWISVSICIYVEIQCQSICWLWRYMLKFSGNIYVKFDCEYIGFIVEVYVEIDEI
jgi:hypothetical protein